MPVPYPNYQSYTAPSAEPVVTAFGDASGVYVAPYVAAMDASGSADIATIRQQKVRIEDIHYALTHVLDEANSVKLLNAFDVSGYGPAGGFNVRVSNKDALAEVLKVALDAKTLGATGSPLKTDIANRIKYLIQADGLINSVEDVNASLTVGVDTSGGATNAANEIYAAPSYAEILYRQIPKGTYQVSGLGLYMDASEEPITRAMPMARGDKIVFVWDIALANIVPTFTPGALAGTGEGNVASGSTDATAYSGSMTVALTRRLALTIQLDEAANGTKAFSLKSATA